MVRGTGQCLHLSHVSGHSLVAVHMARSPLLLKPAARSHRAAWHLTHSPQTHSLPADSHQSAIYFSTSNLASAMCQENRMG